MLQVQKHEARRAPRDSGLVRGGGEVQGRAGSDPAEAGTQHQPPDETVRFGPGQPEGFARENGEAEGAGMFSNVKRFDCH